MLVCRLSPVCVCVCVCQVPLLSPGRVRAVLRAVKRHEDNVELEGEEAGLVELGKDMLQLREDEQNQDYFERRRGELRQNGFKLHRRYFPFLQVHGVLVRRLEV